MAGTIKWQVQDRSTHVCLRNSPPVYSITGSLSNPRVGGGFLASVENTSSSERFDC